MNKQTRLVVSFLFIVVIILAAAITHFYLSVPADTTKDSTQTEIVRKGASDTDGNYIFTDANGRYGLADSDNRILINSEWTDLRFATGGKCIVTSGIGSSRLFGCVDRDGNIVIPLIYSNISKLSLGGSTYYSAESASDGRYVLYDRQFEPCFRRTWKSCSTQGADLVLTDGGGTYTFTHSSDGLLFKRAAYSGMAMGASYSVELNSRVLLSKLTVPMIEDMTDMTEKYVVYAYSDDDEVLSGITKGSRAGFSPLFPDDHRLLSKWLFGISDVHIYSVRSENDVPCYEVTFSAETEVIYTDENGERKALRDKYKVAVGFSGTSENDLKAIYGSFEKDAPDYPEPEKKDEKPADDEAEKNKADKAERRIENV